MTTPLPADLVYEQAAVLPLALSTAACGLFQRDQMALAYPRTSPVPSGKTVLVWGGSTSVGSNAIQLAVAAGYEVFTTASPNNHAYVRGLGAAQVFDYRSPTAVRDIVRAMQGRTIAGALAIGAGSAAPCIAVAGSCKGNRFVSVATPPVSFEDAPPGNGRVWLAGKLVRMITGMLGLTLRARRRGVRFKMLNGSTLLNDGVGDMIFASFLPQALALQCYRAAPEALVVGTGLSAIPEAIERQKKGLSVKKVVVTLCSGKSSSG